MLESGKCICRPGATPFTGFQKVKKLFFGRVKGKVKGKVKRRGLDTVFYNIFIID
jgi:hypothetical protein